MDRIQNIVGSMRGYSTGSMDRTEINLLEAIEDALTILDWKRKERNIEISFKRREPIKILGYTSLNQVLVNILDNAIDAVEPSQGKIAIDIYEDHGKAMLTIEDNGAGIPPDVLPQIFDPFLTTKPAGAGTGLGLFIAKDIVELQHSGRIGVKSTLGQGTVFSVELPNEAPILKTAKKIPFHGMNLGHGG